MTERRGRTTLADKARRLVVLPKLTYFASHFGHYFGDQAVLVIKDSMVITITLS